MRGATEVIYKYEVMLYLGLFKFLKMVKTDFSQNIRPQTYSIYGQI